MFALSSVEFYRMILDTIVSISTILTLAVIWLTLREIKVQRYKTFEPELFPINFNLHFTCETEKILPVDISFDPENKIKVETNDPLFEIKNIGQGTAR